MEKPSFNLVRQILRSPLFLSHSTHEKQVLLDNIIKTGEITRDEILMLINEVRGISRDRKIIQGPIALYEMRIPILPGGKTPKHIYLFGDHHVRESTCTREQTIVDFISETLLLNGNKIIDFYAEVPFGAPSELVPSYIADLSKVFENCYYNKASCQYKNARFHYSDIRQGRDSDLILVLELDLTLREEIRKETKSKAQTNLELLRILEQYENYPVVREFLSQPGIFDFQPLRKQLEKSYIRDKILGSYGGFINDAMITYRELINEIKAEIKSGYPYSTPDVIFEQWRIARDSLSLALVAYVDIYTLLRIFRSFRMLPGRIEKEEPENIIIYMGNRHIINIVNFLKEIGGEVIHEAHSEDEGVNYQCLDISDFKLPFFQ